MINYIKSEKDLASSLITSLGMVGKFMGALLAGWYTDKFGRKNSLMVYTFCHVVFTFAMAFCQNEWSFTAMRVMTMCVNVSFYSLLLDQYSIMFNFSIYVGYRSCHILLKYWDHQNAQSLGH